MSIGGCSSTDLLKSGLTPALIRGVRSLFFFLNLAVLTRSSSIVGPSEYREGETTLTAVGLLFRFRPDRNLSKKRDRGVSDRWDRREA